MNSAKLALYIIASFLATAAAAAERWIKDDMTGCEMLLSTRKPDATVRWNGQCNNGKATGKGRLQYFLDGREYYSAEFAQGNGYAFADGIVVFNLNEVRTKLTCAPPSLKEGGTRKLMITMQSTKPPPMSITMREAAGKHVLEKCPVTPQPYDFRRIEISVVLPDGSLILQWVGSGSLFQQGEISWEKSVLTEGALKDAAIRMNRILGEIDQARASQQAQVQAEEGRRRAEMEKRQRQEANQKAAAAVSARSSKTMSLADRYGARDGWIPWDQVSANAFAHEGKVYLVNTKFQRMIARDAGLFGDALAPDVIVMGLPSTAFTLSGKWVVLVAKVMEPDTTRSNASGRAQFLRLKYLGHEFCTVSGCDDFGDFHRR